ncbi:MAG: hypothetical protein FJ189_07600 [Gammaproteobacteria bacterium]|nr:hypothetical protein [Gammaproteobacteria bacterium]
MSKASSDGSGKRLRDWERLRSRGRSRFIWSYGVLRWGGFMFCFSLTLFQYRQFGNPWSLDGNALLRLILGGAVWAYVGYLYGRSVWSRNEREYAARSSTST